jgi:hypothetical protein
LDASPPPPRRFGRLIRWIGTLVLVLPLVIIGIVLRSKRKDKT